MRWSRPSPEGRRIALDRKWRHNVGQYGGKVLLLTLTPPGLDLLPFGDERAASGKELVEWIYRETWNATAQRRASRLFEAAQRAADRWVRKLWGGELPRQIGNVRALQERGVYHFHYVLPFETGVEREWSRTVVRYMNNAWRTDQRRWPDEQQRRDLIFREYAGEPTRGFYGFGFVKRGNPAGKTSETAAVYMSRNAAGYMASNAYGRSSHYVSSRLTSASGVTMRALRACNWLYVRRKLIAKGELDDDWIPSHWSDEHRERVLTVWAMIQPARAP
jgi:hypothetical protein